MLAESSPPVGTHASAGKGGGEKKTLGRDEQIDAGRHQSSQQSCMVQLTGHTWRTPCQTRQCTDFAAMLSDESCSSCSARHPSAPSFARSAAFPTCTSRACGWAAACCSGPSESAEAAVEEAPERLQLDWLCGVEAADQVEAECSEAVLGMMSFCITDCNAVESCCVGVLVWPACCRSPQHTQVTPLESHSYSSDQVEDQPLELDTASDDEEHDADMPAISIEEGNLDTTTSMQSSEYFDEYEFNQQHPDSIHNKNNVTEKMSKDISDKVTAAESLSSMSSTRSGQVYSESTSKAKVRYDILSGDEINVKGFLSMGKDDLKNGGTIKPTFLIRTLVKAYKTLAKEEPSMRTHAAREIALLRNPKTMAEALRTPQRVEWIDAINKEMSSLVDKDVYAVRKLPVGRKLIPTKLVLKIKLASDGGVDKHKARCVVAGYRQTAGLDYDPEGV